MEPTRSVSKAIELARLGDKLSQDFLFERHFDRLVRAALPFLSFVRPGVRDAETAASSTMREVLQRLEAGELPGVADRSELLAYVMFVVRSKALQLVRRENAEKRGGRITGEMNELAPGHDSASDYEAWIVDRNPVPDEIVAMKEFYECAKRVLTSPLDRVFDLIIEGHNAHEVGEILGYTESWVKKAKARIVRTLQVECVASR